MKDDMSLNIATRRKCLNPKRGGVRHRGIAMLINVAECWDRFMFPNEIRGKH